MSEAAEPASDLPRACRIVQGAAREAGIAIDILTMDDSTRTAEEAAAACRCSVGQIVKSLVFQGKETGRPILLLVSGDNRVRENHVARTIGEKIVRPEAGFVREMTGFAIGGIPPFGHAQRIDTWMDRDLLKHERVFAAAGTPNSVFAIDPAALRDVTGAPVIDVTGSAG